MRALGFRGPGTSRTGPDRGPSGMGGEGSGVARVAGYPAPDAGPLRVPTPDSRPPGEAQSPMCENPGWSA